MPVKIFIGLYLYKRFAKLPNNILLKLHKINFFLNNETERMLFGIDKNIKWLKPNFKFKIEVEFSKKLIFKPTPLIKNVVALAFNNCFIEVER